MISGAILHTSCKKEALQNPEINSETEATNYNPNPDNKIVLGKRVENPYSVENMEKAYQALSLSHRLQADSSPVKTTHLYVRFLPKDWAQYDTLVADTNLELYNIPLDYEIAVCGNSYHDPSIPADLPTWQYTTVPVDFQFNPDIKHEILTEAYIPELDPTLNTISTNQRKAYNGKSFKDALLDQAFILTKNYSDTLKNYNGAKTNWTPSGNIKVYDTRLGKDVPLEGVKIRVRRWIFVKIIETTTNANGYYQTESFDREVNYSVIFETNNFDIRTGTFGQVSYDGPKKREPWSITFSVDDANRFYAHVFRGAYRYHYKDIGGLKRPNVWSKIKYCCYDKEKDGINGDFWGNWDGSGLLPDIRIWGREGGRYKDSDDIFSTTIHETAHASHAQLLNAKGVGMAITSNKIVESWAVAVEWQVIAMEYREKGIPNFANEYYSNTKIGRLQYAYQWWTKENEGTNYTSLFIDLVDNYNQKNTQWKNTDNNVTYNGLNDNVSGYTLSGIENNILFKVTGVDTWIGSLRTNLKANKPTGVTDNQIDELLNQF